MCLLQMTLGTILLNVVIVIVVVVIVYWKWTDPTTKGTAVTPWTQLTSTTGAPWDQMASTDGSLLFRPWSGRGTGMAEYLGIIKVKKGEILEISVPQPLPTYWEYDIYEYPTWNLIYAVPLRHIALVGGSEFPLETGSYCIILRAVGASPELMGVGSPTLNTQRGGVRFIPREIQVQSRPPKQPANDEHLYGDVNTLMEQVLPQMEKQSYRVSTTMKSQTLAVKPVTPYIRMEQLEVNLDTGQVMVLVYPWRPAVTILSITDNGDTTFPETSTQLQHHVITADQPTHIVVKESMFGLHPDSQMLPLYAYIFVKE